MAPSAQPTGLRSPEDTPRPPGGAPGPGPAALAGGGPGGPGEEGAPPEAATPAGGGPGGGMTAMLGQSVQQVMKTETMLTDMARQFPAAAPSFRRAVDGLRDASNALRAALRQLMTNPGQPEPPSPGIGG